jgi:hypothetical protein
MIVCEPAFDLDRDPVTTAQGFPELRKVVREALFGYLGIAQRQQTIWKEDCKNYQFTSEAFILGKHFQVAHAKGKSLFVQCRSDSQRGTYYAQVLHFVHLNERPEPNCCIVKLLPHLNQVHAYGDDENIILDSTFEVHLIKSPDIPRSAGLTKFNVAVVPVNHIWSACIKAPYEPRAGYSVILPLRREL